MNDTDRTPQLTHRGAFRKIGHSAAVIAAPEWPLPAPAPESLPSREEVRPLTLTGAVLLELTAVVVAAHGLHRPAARAAFEADFRGCLEAFLERHGRTEEAHAAGQEAPWLIMRLLALPKDRLLALADDFERRALEQRARGADREGWRSTGRAVPA